MLLEVRRSESAQSSLSHLILDIETLPSEPTLLKSHLSRLHSQRHAILSLVESVDLVKKGEGTTKRNLADFLGEAIKTLISDEAKAANADDGIEDAPAARGEAAAEVVEDCL